MKYPAWVLVPFSFRCRTQRVTAGFLDMAASQRSGQGASLLCSWASVMLVVPFLWVWRTTSSLQEVTKPLPEFAPFAEWPRRISRTQHWEGLFRRRQTPVKASALRTQCLCDLGHGPHLLRPSLPRKWGDPACSRQHPDCRRRCFLKPAQHRDEQRVEHRKCVLRPAHNHSPSNGKKHSLEASVRADCKAPPAGVPSWKALALGSTPHLPLCPWPWFPLGEWFISPISDCGSWRSAPA